MIRRSVRLLFSAELLSEIEATLQKLKLARYFYKTALMDMLVAIEPFMEFIQVHSTVQEARDPKDDFLLALARDGRDDYLITADRDLLILDRYGETTITTFTSFLREFLVKRK